MCLQMVFFLLYPSNETGLWIVRMEVKHWEKFFKWFNITIFINCLVLKTASSIQFFSIRSAYEKSAKGSFIPQTGTVNNLTNSNSLKVLCPKPWAGAVTIKVVDVTWHYYWSSDTISLHRSHAVLCLQSKSVFVIAANSFPFLVETKMLVHSIYESFNVIDNVCNLIT